MPYPELMVRPMREELTVAGFSELRDATQVDDWMKAEGTKLLVVNSVCGCAAGMARPGVRIALDGTSLRPDHLGTVFAGQDVEATHTARGFFPEIPPSSPSMAMFKGGELVFFLPRHRIEGRTADEVAADLTAAFDEHCG
ncbi:MAG: BrxA/BrxB family bacilliredoxin [Acidobacteriota bacterium]